MAPRPPRIDRSPSFHSGESAPNIGSSSFGSTKNRKSRGRALEHNIASLPKGTKLSLEFDDKHRVIGVHRPLFASQQGIVIRNMQVTSVVAPSWIKLDKDVNTKMLESVLEKFDMGDDPERKKLLMKEMGKKMEGLPI